MKRNIGHPETGVLLRKAERGFVPFMCTTIRLGQEPLSVSRRILQKAIHIIVYLYHARNGVIVLHRSDTQWEVCLSGT